MSKTKIVVSNEEARKTQIAKHAKKLRDLHDLKRIDAIVVQQHVIRRFKFQHGACHAALLGMRGALDDFLAEKGLEIACGQDGYISRPQLLACVMNFCWKKGNVETLRSGKLSAIHKDLEDHILEFFERSRDCPLLESGDIPRLTKILLRYSPDVAEMHRRFNYLTYFSPYGMTSEVSGEKLYTHYLRAKTGRAPLSPILLGSANIALSPSPTDIPDVTVNADLPEAEARWLYTRETEQDEDLSALVQARCYLASSLDCKVFAGWKSEILIDGVAANDYLVLAMPVSRFPAKIDAVLEEFREALLFELTARTRLVGDNIDRAEVFYESAFANTLSHHPCLVTSFEGIQTKLLGLWAWDLGEAEAINSQKASEAVCNGVEALKVKLGKPRGIVIPAWESVEKNGYNNVSAFVKRPSTRRKQAPTDIDRYLTGTRTIILGEVAD